MDAKVQTGEQEKIEISGMTLPVIITDESGVVRVANRFAEKLAAGHSLVGSKIDRVLNIRQGRAFIGGETYRVAVSPYDRGEGNGYLYVLMSLEDVLQEESEYRVRELSEMMAEIAHEIRNPLGSIELFASLLRKTAVGERDILRIEQIISSVKTINGRISELLRLSKRRALRKQDFCLNRLMQEIFRIPDQTESFLALHFPEEDLPVHGDEKMLRQMFLNLLIQLLQVLPAQAKLCVSAGRRREDRQAYIETMFRCDGEKSLFRQFDLALGLNLAIIHDLIQMHQGIVNIGSHAISILLPAAET